LIKGKQIFYWNCDKVIYDRPIMCRKESGEDRESILLKIRNFP
jgi:hypothetical protein